MFLCVWLNALKISNITTQDFIYIILSFYHLCFLFSPCFHKYVYYLYCAHVYIFSFLSIFLRIFLLNVKSIYGCFNLIFALEGKLAAKHFSRSILSFFMRMRIGNCLVEGKWKFYSVLCSFLLKRFFFVLLLFSFFCNIPDIYISNITPLGFFIVQTDCSLFVVILKTLFVGRYKLFA